MAKTSKKEESTSHAALDQKDLAILKLLQYNARATVKEISDNVNLSTTPVYERIKMDGRNRGDQAICNDC